MPKFSKQEKEILKRKLEAEGERLFAAFGIKKVTIDNLVEAAGIAKATFYTFYASKEYLYMDIVQSIQQKIFSEAEDLLKHNSTLDSRERVKQVFALMSQSMMSYPILRQIDLQTIEYLERKVSKERFITFQKSNIDAAWIMNQQGVRFKYNVEIASLAFQALYRSWIFLQDQNADTQKAVIDIMLNGVLEQIVE